MPPENNHTPLVEFRDVSLTFNGGNSIIDRLNLSVISGETLEVRRQWTGT
jgi:hypothetical protein